MKTDKIKPIPKYIAARIKRSDERVYPTPSGRTRFYSYLTKNDGELVKVTVAVRNYYKYRLCKQVAVHGLDSDVCFVKDMIFYCISGYSVGWYEQGAQKSPRWYESTEWCFAEDKYFDPYAPVLNREYIDKSPEFRYSAVNLYKGVDVIRYLRYYRHYPQIEYVIKAGLHGYIFSKQILRKAGKDKRFCKWLFKNREDIIRNHYYVDVILRSYKTNKPLAELQAQREYGMKLSKDAGLNGLKTFFASDLERFVSYIRKQNANVYSYRDYFRACNYLGLDMTRDKNRYPKDFRRWHDVRIDEYNTAKAMKDAEERKAFYDKFASVASKYAELTHDKRSVFVAVLPQSPYDLVREGNALHHCVGRMNYDRKFIREETLIVFIREKERADVPFVTVEYSPSQRKILQCYGEHDSKPDDSVLDYVNNVWLPYANRKIRKITKAA